jgi:hypothetical protein
MRPAAEKRFSDSDIEAMRVARAGGASLKEIAARFGCGPHYVCDVTRGRARRVVQGPLEQRPGRKLSLDQAREIRLLRQGNPGRRGAVWLAAQFSVSVAMIYQVLGGRAWADG